MYRKIVDLCWGGILLVIAISSCTPTYLPENLVVEIAEPSLAAQIYYLDRRTDILGRFTVAYSFYELSELQEEFLPGSNEHPDSLISMDLLVDGVRPGKFKSYSNEDDNFFTHKLNLDHFSIGDGSEVSIRITHPNFSEITAKDQMPEKVPTINAKLLGPAGVSDFTSEPEILYAVEISFPDPSGNNFYQISIGQDTFRIVGSDTIPTMNISPIKIDDPTYVTLLNRTYLFSDQSFENEEANLVIKTPTKVTPRTRIVLRNISRSWFEYDLSFFNQLKPYVDVEVSTTLLGAYFQLSDIDSNIEGGLGCLCLGREKWFTVDP